MQTNHPTDASVPAAEPPRRALALDAFRGLAILMMVFSGVLPFGKNTLPSWMYHCQEPPPAHDFNPAIRGITWVDLVFPYFLFALGAAIPLALGRRLDRGEATRSVLLSICERGVLLGFFALFCQHIRPYTLNGSPDWVTWVIALAGFGLLFLLYARMPESIGKPVRIGLKALGWALAIGWLVVYVDAKGRGFSWTRNDIILCVLANMAFFGSLLWLVTRHTPLARLWILALLLAFRLTAGIEGSWARQLASWIPGPRPWLSWIFNWEFQKYLFIVLPATMIGEFIADWMRSRSSASESEDASTALGPRGPLSAAGATSLLTVVALGFQVAMLVGLKTRWLLPNFVTACALAAVALWLTAAPRNDTGRLWRHILLWGTSWLFIGLAFEPYEGGIRKDHATYSYFFVTTGLSCYTVVGLHGMIARARAAFVRRPLTLLVENGQNPMIGYVGIMNLVWPIIHLTGLHDRIAAVTQSPWLGAARGAFYTLVVALVAAALTRRKIVWRT